MSDDPTSRRRRMVSSIAQAYRESHEVMSAAMSIALLTGLGYWLDSKFGWKPVLMICGLLIGSLMAAASLRRMLVRLDRQSKGQDTDSSSEKASGR